MTQTYTCYEEWYADHIADLDDADKAEAAQRKIEVGSQDALMWKALYEKRGEEIAKLREELAGVSHGSYHLPEAQRYGGDLVFAQDASTHALVSIAESLATLASCITDYGSTVPYIRTGKVGGE